MGFFSSTCIFSIFMFCFSSLSVSQQPYLGIFTTDCSNKDGFNSAFGYTCNGLYKTCQAYLIFRSEPPYNTVPSISHLLASDPSQTLELNSIPEAGTLATNELVIVPIECSCSGMFYQSNISYVVQSGDTYFDIANKTFQGLTTCQALEKQNSNMTTKYLYSGTKISVPLRCACPTRNQTDLGFDYLLTYLVAKGDFVSSIAAKFGSDTGWTLEANGISEEDSTIYPFTTLLVPLKNKPSGSQIIEPPLPPPPPSLPPTSPSSKSLEKPWIYALLGAVGGGAFVLVLSTVVFCIILHKYKKNFKSNITAERFEAQEEKSDKNMVEEESKDFLENMSEVAQSLKVFDFEELQTATNDFSPASLIGGSVYRGVINGYLAAIKRMNGDVSKEINLLQKINHSNLTQLCGVCSNEGHWYLVYEYVSNGPLSNWIYNDNNEGKFLTWTQRVQIALDVATGLNYLHSFANPSQLHKDINSSNILLNSDFRAKIANFGSARSAEAEEGEFTLTNHIVGTIGYMAPEYLENGLVSTKLDVFSFGVLLLEMLTGKDIAVLYEENKNLYDTLIAVLSDEGQESLRRFMDSSMQEKYPSELAGFVVRIIDSCLEKNPQARPTMDEIVQSLSRTLSNSLAWELSNNLIG